MLLLSSLLFADDTLIFFCKANLDHLYNLQCIVLCFEVVSGLKINLAKSEIVPIGSAEDFGGLASIFLVVAWCPFLAMKYLGISFGALFKVKSI
jgi:hypothetical protein